ncbi:hypothetical protein PFISCL1PPCAC_1395, partial [Pristionchus fissidentatus]
LSESKMTLCDCLCKLILLIFATVCPPLAVLLYDGCHSDLCINLILTLVFFVPGVLHAWYVILTKEQSVYSPTTVVHVHAGGAPLYNM